MDRPLVACVLAGGTGTRLYPASRPDTPKQLRRFGGDRSLLARTVSRAAFADAIYVLTRPSLADPVRETLSTVTPETPITVLTEPESKDTGPALVYAAGRIDAEFERSPVLCCLPSDHHVPDGAAFARELRMAACLASDSRSLVTLGIEPTRPATGYGYIDPDRDSETSRETTVGSGIDSVVDPEPGRDSESGPASDTNSERPSHAPVAAFHEKPDAETAARYVECGCLWNAGIFTWTPAALFAAAEDTPLGALAETMTRNPTDRAAIETAFGSIEPVSIDHAVLEPAASTGHVAVLEATFEWDDLGTWDALSRLGDADRNDTTVIGDALAIDTDSTVLASDGDLQISALGVSDLVIAAYDDRVLVVPTDETQRVREVVAELRERGRF
jgi:mannose-1-phosphate guanylyltransferase